MVHKQPKQKIVIVGGGFAGVKTALVLARRPDLFDITLISERPDFWYYPTLYHTATGGSRQLSALPLKHILAGKPVELIVQKAEKLDHAAKHVVLHSKRLVPYDKLVLALGVVTNYFGISGLAEFSYGVKSIDDAERFKRHLHQQIVDTHQPDLNYVIVGGGATGIELAGNLGEYIKHIMKQHGLPRRRIHIDLVEGAPHLMPRMPRAVGRAIERRLRKLGVRLYLGKAVQGETADALTVAGKPIRSHTVLWTAGQANNPFFVQNGFALTPHHKVAVDEFLRAGSDVFVIGDNADTPYSGMAQTALYDAEFVAHNFVKEAENEPKLAYRPKKPIYVTPAGKRWAAVEWGNVHMYGLLGWLLRDAADFKAFADLEPLPDAALQWLRGFEHQDLCPVCGNAA